jgi:hypothetical protein
LCSPTSSRTPTPSSALTSKGDGGQRLSSRWPLAQYYTDRVLDRLERRYSGALNVFRGLLPHQPAAYRAHEQWLADSSPEAVRRAMLEVRRWKEGKLSDFNRRLKVAHEELQPNS